MRVIQDSDEEFEDEAEVIASPPKVVDASDEQGRVKDASSVTGSTESLKRAFAEAHRNHLQAPSAPSRSEPQSSVSLPEQPTKRRKTSTNISPRDHSSATTPLKERVIYGKRSKTLVNSPNGSIFVNDNGACVSQHDVSHANNKAWDLPGTIRENWVQHEPNELFPEPSSTIPNATMTQQRVLERVLAPAFLGTESDVEAPPHKSSLEPSIPWSDLLNLSPVDTGGQSDPHEPQAGSGSPPPNLDLNAGHAQKSPSQPSRRGSSANLRGSPLRKEIILENVDTEHGMPPPKAVLSSQDLSLTPKSSKRSQRRTQEEVQKSSQRQTSKMSSVPNSEDDLAAIGLPKEQYVPRPSCSRSLEVDVLDDLAAIGLPREQYVPRPSRSRSLKVDLLEPVDFSVRPEKAGKAARRRKTTATASVETTDTANALGTPQKCRKLVEMGFTPRSSERALKEHDGDVDRTVDWLVANGMEEDELARDTPRVKPPDEVLDTHEVVVTGGTSATAKCLPDTNVTADEYVAPDFPVKISGADDSSAALAIPTSPQAALKKSPKVQVVIPPRSPQKVGLPEPSKKKAKRRKTTLDAPEPNATLEPLELTSKNIEKKQKERGRPKKADNTALPIDVTPKIPEAAKQEDKVLQPIEANAIVPDSNLTGQEKAIPIETVEKSRHASDAPQSLPPTTTIAPKDQSPAATTHTPEPTLKRKTESPASTGKISYRVGLSKRARIAPLLRIMKK